MSAIVWLLLGVSLAQEAPEAASEGSIEGKPGKGITLRAPGDTASMNLKVRFQVRATEEIPTEDGEDPFSEISIRRARLTLAGHVWDEDLTYQMQLAFSSRDLESDLPRPLHDAYVNYAIGEAAELRVGQYVVPFSRSRVTSSSVFELVDRSIVVSELNLDRDVGIALHSGDSGFKEGRVGYSLGVYGGEGRNRLGTELGWLVVGRVALRPLGAFDDLTEGDLDRDAKARLALGLNAAYNPSSNRARSTTSDVFEVAHFDYLHAGADLVFKWNGLYLSGEALYREADEDSVTVDGVTEYSRSAWGWFAQGGQMLTDKVDIAARYSELYPLEGTDPELTEERELGGGAGYYFHGHLLKVQADYFYLFGEDLDGGDHQIRTELQVTI